MHPDDFEDNEQTRLDEINERYSDLRERHDPTYAEPFVPPINIMDVSLPDDIGELLDQNGIDINDLPESMQNQANQTWEHAMNIVNAAAFAHWATDGRENWGNLHNHGNKDLISRWLDNYSSVLIGSACPEDFINSDLTEVMRSGMNGDATMTTNVTQYGDRRESNIDFFVHLNDGKYTYRRFKDGSQDALRFGSDWRTKDDLAGDNLIAAMGNLIESQQAQINELRQKLREVVAERGGEAENQAFQRKFPVVMTIGQIASKAVAAHAEADDPLADTKPMCVVQDGFDLPSLTLSREVDMPIFPDNNELAMLTLKGELRDGYAVRAYIEFKRDATVDDVKVSVFRLGEEGFTTAVFPSEQAMSKTPQELERIVLKSTEELIDRHEIHQRMRNAPNTYNDPERCGGPSTDLLM